MRGVVLVQLVRVATAQFAAAVDVRAGTTEPC